MNTVDSVLIVHKKKNTTQEIIIVEFCDDKEIKKRILFWALWN